MHCEAAAAATAERHGILVHVAACDRLFVQFDPDRVIYDKMQVHVEKFHYDEMPFVPSVGQLCAAKYEDVMYRAKCLWVKPNVTSVEFIDFGNTESVSSSSIRQLPADLCSVKALAQCCCLANLAISDEQEAMQLLQAEWCYKPVAVRVMEALKSSVLSVDMRRIGGDCNDEWLSESLLQRRLARRFVHVTVAPIATAAAASSSDSSDDILFKGEVEINVASSSSPSSQLELLVKPLKSSSDSWRCRLRGIRLRSSGRSVRDAVDAARRATKRRQGDEVEAVVFVDIVDGLRQVDVEFVDNEDRRQSLAGHLVRLGLARRLSSSSSSLSTSKSSTPPSPPRRKSSATSATSTPSQKAVAVPQISPDSAINCSGDIGDDIVVGSDIDNVDIDAREAAPTSPSAELRVVGCRRVGSSMQLLLAEPNAELLMQRMQLLMADVVWQVVPLQQLLVDKLYGIRDPSSGLILRARISCGNSSEFTAELIDVADEDGDCCKRSCSSCAGCFVQLPANVAALPPLLRCVKFGI